MATAYATPRIARSKSGADLLFDRMKHEQFQSDERAAIDYLNSVLDISITYDTPLHKELKDGVLLCNLVNKLKPGTIKQVGQKDLSFIKMDNITRFLQGARQLGLNNSQLFETIDLFEAKDMAAVIHTILAISRLTEEQILAAQQQKPEKKQQEKLNSNDIYEETKYAGHQHSFLSQDTTTSEENYQLIDEEEESMTKYRDVRDIFSGYNSSAPPKENNRLRLNRDALATSRKTGLRATYAGPAHKKSYDDGDEEDYDDYEDDLKKKRLQSRTTPSSPTSSHFARPPKSPLRSPPHEIEDYNHSRYYSVDNIPSLSENPLARSQSSVSSVSSGILPKTPKNASFASRKKQPHSSLLTTTEEGMILEESNDDGVLHRQQRRLSSPASVNNKRHSHTFPNRGNMSSKTSTQSLKKLNEMEEPPVKAGSLGHKLDRQYRETANEILAKKPDGNSELDKEERLLSYCKDGVTTTQYQLGNCIGKGQFGSVYRALDLATGEIVAVKRLCLEDGDIDQEIMKEVALLKTLSHTNVIRYLGFIQSQHSINIILEFAENGSLMSTLKAFGAFPEKLVASFCIKILSGLEYLHQNQVVHCDLKAANILTTKTGDVKLTDFGVSLNLKIKGADAGAVSGTPNWMAPEVIELKGASTKSDIWSLGCTLVELVTGKPPYADMIAMSAMFRIVEDQCPPLPENISEDMKDFLRACFQKDPALRPSATELKQHPWILQNQQRIRKTETYSHDLSSYLRNHSPSTIRHQEEDEEEDLEQSNMTLRSCSGIDFMNPNESQMTLYDDEKSSVAEDSIENLKVMAGLRNEEDYITHRFIHTSFGKVVECKVCGDLMTTQSIFCEVCALICHEECRKSAFSCPPKVNDQQPSYDWVFSAKVYNRGHRKSHDPKRNSMASTKSIRKSSPPIQLKPEDAESIRQYALALGLTPQEEEALNGNQALLSHTLLLQQQHKIDPGTMRHKALTTKSLNGDHKKKRHLSGRRPSEECIIS